MIPKNVWVRDKSPLVNNEKWQLQYSDLRPTYIDLRFSDCEGYVVK